MALVSKNVSLEPYDRCRRQKSYKNVRRMLSIVYFHCKTKRNAANITPNFEKSRSKISHFRPQKSEKVLWNLVGTGYRLGSKFSDSWIPPPPQRLRPSRAFWITSGAEQLAFFNEDSCYSEGNRYVLVHRGLGAGLPLPTRRTETFYRHIWNSS